MSQNTLLFRITAEFFVQYAFSIMNLKNPKATVRHESPREGRKFQLKDDTLSWGWKEFARKDRICQNDRGYIFDLNKIQVELEIKVRNEITKIFRTPYFRI